MEECEEEKGTIENTRSKTSFSFCLLIQTVTRRQTVLGIAPIFLFLLFPFVHGTKSGKRTKQRTEEKGNFRTENRLSFFLAGERKSRAKRLWVPLFVSSALSSGTLNYFHPIWTTETKGIDSWPFPLEEKT